MERMELSVLCRLCLQREAWLRLGRYCAIPCRWLLTVLTICCCLVGISAADEPVTPEYKLKAALIYKLTHFVSWPEWAYKNGSDRNEYFSICILGDNVFGDLLEPLRKREVKGIPINIRYYGQSEDINRYCQLLYISDSKSAFTREILQRFKRQATLTISDINQFASQGGMIELTQGNNKIGFTINPKIARRQGLSIAAPLLELANITESDHEP